MKLESGREVKLVPLTVEQRIDCEDTITKISLGDGKMELGNLSLAKHKWAMHGLGKDSLNDLKKYTPDEIGEISLAVQEADEKTKNPTT